MNEKVINLINKLSQTDIEALKSIYYFRCLNEDLLYQMHYNKSVTGEIQDRGLVRRKIRLFKKLSLIDEVNYGIDLPALFLTSEAINVIRYSSNLSTNIYDAKKEIIKRGYYRASELRIYPKNINHQMHLNTFVIELQTKLQGLYPSKYYDEKHMSQYLRIRPDGLIQLLDVDFLLEMDMATESHKQLCEKWDNYRNFLTSREYAYRDRKIVMLFIVSNTDKLEDRKDLVRHSLSERLLDAINSDFDIYIGSKDELIDMVFKKAIPNLQGINELNNAIEKLLEVNHGFDIKSGETLKRFLCDTEYGLYIRKVNNNNNVIVENGKVQEFLFDEYSHRPISVLKKIAYLDRNNTVFKQNFNREISYLILVDNEETIFHDLKISGLVGIDNIYFTTLGRLKVMNFSEAIFQIDYLGNVHHFLDNGLTNRIFEKTLIG